jgi:hypothetical protein
MKKYFKKDKPINNQIIGFRAKKSHYPEIGVFKSYDEGVYVPANIDVEQIINIEYWFEVPQLESKVEESLTIFGVRKRCFNCDSLNIKHLETYNECQDCKSIM